MALQNANIVGSGPNGLAAAITLARAGVSVTVFERNGRAGGACSTAEVTLPGFRHDLGSSVYPLGVASPFFQSLPLGEYGLRWLEPEAPLTHPLDDGTCLTLEHSMEATAGQFDVHDARAWRSLLGPTVRDWPALVRDFTRPLLRMPSSPVAMANFGLAAMWPAQGLARTVFRSGRAQALFAGCAAHSVLPLTRMASAAPGLVLAAAGHATGWPIVAGGAQALTDSLVAYLESLGGRVVLHAEVRALEDLPKADATLFDTSAAALERIAGPALSDGFVRRLRGFRPGPGIFKVDCALSEPIPWSAAETAGQRPSTWAEAWRRLRGQSMMRSMAGTRMRLSCCWCSRACWTRRARAGRGQAYGLGVLPCAEWVGDGHDGGDRAADERFAPGFRDCILARRPRDAAAAGGVEPKPGRR